MIDHYHIDEFPSDGSLAKSTKSVQLYGRDNYMRFRAKLVSANPGLMLEVVDTTSKLDDAAGKATVCVTCRLLHYEHIDMKSRESVVFMDWVRRKGDQWVCIKSKVMHGYSHLPSFPTLAKAEGEPGPASAGPSPQESRESVSAEPDVGHVSELGDYNICF